MSATAAKERAERIRIAMSAGVAGVVAAGGELIDWKQSLPRGEFGPMVRDQLGWNDSKAERLMVVASHEVIANPANFAGFPPSPNTLYELAKLGESLAEALASGEVHPDMRGSDASQLYQKYRRNTASRKAERATAAPAPSLPTSVAVICADSAKVETWAGVTADLAIFSPPYNWGEDYDEYEDMLSPPTWRALLADVVDNLIGAGVARIAINVPGALGRRPYFPVVPEVLAAIAGLVDLEAEIIWDKATTGNRTSWGSWRSPADPCLRDRTERILIFRTGAELRIPPGVLVYDDDDGRPASPWLSAERFCELTQDLWKFSPARTDGSHPCPFPVELPRRLLQLYGWPGCTVVDPFAGSGTTGVAAVELGASAVLIDLSRSYCEVATQRVAAAAEAVA